MISLSFIPSSFVILCSALNSMLKWFGLISLHRFISQSLLLSRFVPLILHHTLFFFFFFFLTLHWHWFKHVILPISPLLYTQLPVPLIWFHSLTFTNPPFWFVIITYMWAFCVLFRLILCPYLNTAEVANCLDGTAEAAAPYLQIGNVFPKVEKDQ